VAAPADLAAARLKGRRGTLLGVVCGRAALAALEKLHASAIAHGAMADLTTSIAAAILNQTKPWMTLQEFLRAVSGIAEAEFDRRVNEWIALSKKEASTDGNK
jgi:hypothetical protein